MSGLDEGANPEPRKETVQIMNVPNGSYNNSPHGAAVPLICGFHILALTTTGTVIQNNSVYERIPSS